VGDDSLSPAITTSDGAGSYAGTGILGIVPAARGNCIRVCTRTEIQLRPSAAKLRHGTACPTKIVETPIRAAFAVAATEAIRAEKSRLAGAWVRRAVGFAFSLIVALASVLEMSLTATLAVTRSFTGSGQERRVRREQTRTEEKTKGSPPRPRLSKQSGDRVKPLAVHFHALHRDSTSSEMSQEANSPD
jgi:hypothetical protein